MPTIKTKKEMNLGELLCWAIDNKEQARFRDFSSKSMRVRFNDSAKPEIIFAKRFLPIEQTFKVEIEEPITEDTKLEEIFLITNNSIYSEKCYNYSINDALTDNEGYYEEVAMLILEPEPLIIWTKEKGLVE